MVYRFTWFTWLNEEFYKFLDGLQVYLVYMIMKEIELVCGFWMVYGFTLFTWLNREFDNFVDGLQVYLVYMIMKEIGPLIIQYCSSWQVFKFTWFT